MKPKLRFLVRKALPALIIVPAMMQAAHAATIAPDGFGNVTVTVGDSGAHNVATGFGFVPVIPPGAHQIIVDAGASLTPGGTDVIEVQVFDAVGATYTITNNGTLQADGGAANYGISTADIVALATPSITVFNNGIISGVGAIRANNQLTLTNTGTLTATGLDASVFTKNGGSVTNTNGGLISGVTYGVRAEAGILTVGNTGTIEATGLGIGVSSIGAVQVTNGVDIFDIGLISGGADGVYATGVGSTVINNEGSSIIGTTGYGVRLDDGATITNNGTISGGTFGARVSDGSVINNTGTITGGNIGIDAFAGAGTFILNNSGTITGTGGVAIDGAISGVDTLNLNGGSVINGDIVTRGGADIVNVTADIFTNSIVTGDILTGSGSDTINLTSNFVGSSIVNGDVNGGVGNDTINFIGGLTTIGGGTNVINGQVSFIETIAKSNAGTAFINSPGLLDVNTVNITGGGLYLNGNVDGNTVAQTTINAGGAALGGTGTWDANIFITAGGFSAGSIPINLDSTPTNAIGLVTVTGDVTHSPGSFIRFDVAPNTLINNGVNSDLIAQTGVGNVYDVNGATLRISTTNGDQAISNGTYTVVASDELIANFGTLAGLAVQFNSNVADTGPFVATESGVSTNTILTTQNFVRAQLSGDGTDIQLVTQHNFAGLPGLTGNQSSLGAALDASVNNGAGPANPLAANPLVQNLIAALDNSNLAAVQQALAVLTPDATLNQAASVVNSNYRLHRLTQEHLASVRGSAEGASASYSQQVGAKGAITQAPQTASGSRFNAWGALSYDWQDYEGRTSTGDFDGDTGSFTAGFDYRVGPALVLGAVLDGSKSDLDYSGGSSDIDSFRGAVYGTWGQSTGLYSDFLLGFGAHDLEGRRSFSGIINGTGSASTDASSVQALWTFGYTMQATNLKHGPFAGLEYQSVDVDSFNATGPFPIGVSDYDLDSLRGLIGYRVNADYGRFKPYATLAYAHEFEDSATGATGNLPNNATFALTGPELGSAIILTLGTGVTITPSLSLDVGYRGEFSLEDEGIDSNGGSVGLNYAF